MMVEEEGSLKILVIKSSILMIAMHLIVSHFLLFFLGLSETATDLIFLIANTTFDHTIF